MSEAVRQTTKERILDGARQALARHGLGKLGMSDVCECAGVSRGTLYRYFATRDELLLDLSHWEAERFRERLLEAMQQAPEDEGRLRLMFEAATRHVQEDPALQRLLESDGARVLQGIRQQYGAIRQQLRVPLAPILERTAPVRSGQVSVDQLVDWLTRILISIYLFPGTDPKEQEQGLWAMFQMLLSPEGEGGKGGEG